MSIEQPPQNPKEQKLENKSIYFTKEASDYILNALGVEVKKGKVLSHEIIGLFFYSHEVFGAEFWKRKGNCDDEIKRFDEKLQLKEPGKILDFLA